MIKVVTEILTLAEKLKNISLYFVKISKRNKYKKRNYYFTSYKKHLTIYKNGTGILMTNIKMKVVIPENIKNIEREIKCLDGKACLKFPDFMTMKELDIEKRFIDYGFWYKSDNNIVTGVLNNSNCDKCLKLKLNIDEGNLKKGKVYDISYAISIPNMFPITDGKYDSSTLEKKIRRGYKFSSSLEVIHMLESVDYIISFEQGIKLKNAPNCIINIPEYKDVPVHGDHKQNLFYKTYHYKIKNPQINNKIEINWHLEALNKKNQNYKLKQKKDKILSVV